MYVLLHYYVLTASEELRVNFPEGKHLEALGKAGKIEQDKLKGHEEKRIMNDVTSGNIDAVEDTNSTTMDTSLPESKPIVPYQTH